MSSWITVLFFKVLLYFDWSTIIVQEPEGRSVQEHSDSSDNFHRGGRAALGQTWQTPGSWAAFSSGSRHTASGADLSVMFPCLLSNPPLEDKRTALGKFAASHIGVQVSCYSSICSSDTHYQIKTLHSWFFFIQYWKQYVLFGNQTCIKLPRK